MGHFLLDANVLVALAWPQHEFHDRAGRWFERHASAGWATCPFTQTAFVRLLCNPLLTTDALTPANAAQLLATSLDSRNHHFWADSISIGDALKNCAVRIMGHRQITDAYLVGLAIHHRGRLATLDKGIGAWGVGGAVEVIL